MGSNCFPYNQARDNFEKEIRRDSKDEANFEKLSMENLVVFPVTLRSGLKETRVKGRRREKGGRSIEQVSGWGQIIPVSIETKNVFQAALNIAIAIAIVGIRRK